MMWQLMSAWHRCKKKNIRTCRSHAMWGPNRHAESRHQRCFENRRESDIRFVQKSQNLEELQTCESCRTQPEPELLATLRPHRA
eukprot:2313018-Rhodomonas_salina.1